MPELLTQTQNTQSLEAYAQEHPDYINFLTQELEVIDPDTPLDGIYYYSAKVITPKITQYIKKYSGQANSEELLMRRLALMGIGILNNRKFTFDSFSIDRRDKTAKLRIINDLALAILSVQQGNNDPVFAHYIYTILSLYNGIQSNYGTEVSKKLWVDIVRRVSLTNIVSTAGYNTFIPSPSDATLTSTFTADNDIDVIVADPLTGLIVLVNFMPYSQYSSRSVKSAGKLIPENISKVDFPDYSNQVIRRAIGNIAALTSQDNPNLSSDLRERVVRYSSIYLSINNLSARPPLSSSLEQELRYISSWGRIIDEERVLGQTFKDTFESPPSRLKRKIFPEMS